MPPKRKRAKKAEPIKIEHSEEEGEEDVKPNRPAELLETGSSSANTSVNKCVHRAEKGFDGQPTWKLEQGKDRVITVNAFRGQTYINIRDFYQKDGKLLPGKGISLTEKQWDVLGECFEDVKRVLKETK